MSRIPWNLVHWRNSFFLIGTFLLTITAVPAYIYWQGLAAWQVILFLSFFIATGISITLGYHRLFSHRSFQASWPVRFLTLFFGAGAFENSALCWSADHRRHHKYMDHDEDPYDITKGFFHAHIGWILFKLKPETSLDTVKDLQQDRLVMWQHNNYTSIAITSGFILPTLLGGIFGGWIGALGSFLIAGVARTVFVQHMTFFINSLCHTVGSQPYCSKGTARDSAIMAFFTFGEGYHNFHHTFQHDYRNGVKPWQFDPTKWSIQVLHKLGLVKKLRTVPAERIILAEAREKEIQLNLQLAAQPAHPILDSIKEKLADAANQLQSTFQHWEQLEIEYRQALKRRVDASREQLQVLKRQFSEASVSVMEAFREWQAACRLATAQCS